MCSINHPNAPPKMPIVLMSVSLISVNKWKRYTKLASSHGLAYNCCQSMFNTEWVTGTTKGSWVFLAFK